MVEFSATAGRIQVDRIFLCRAWAADLFEKDAFVPGGERIGQERDKGSAYVV